MDNTEVFPEEERKYMKEGQESENKEVDGGSIPVKQVFMAEVDNITHEPFKTTEEIKVLYFIECCFKHLLAMVSKMLPCSC